MDRDSSPQQVLTCDKLRLLSIRHISSRRRHSQVIEDGPSKSGTLDTMEHASLFYTSMESLCALSDPIVLYKAHVGIFSLILVIAIWILFKAFREMFLIPEYPLFSSFLFCTIRTVYLTIYAILILKNPGATSQPREKCFGEDEL